MYDAADQGPLPRLGRRKRHRHCELQLCSQLLTSLASTEQVWDLPQQKAALRIQAHSKMITCLCAVPARAAFFTGALREFISIHCSLLESTGSHDKSVKLFDLTPFLLTYDEVTITDQSLDLLFQVSCHSRRLPTRLRADFAVCSPQLSSNYTLSASTEELTAGRKREGSVVNSESKKRSSSDRGTDDKSTLSLILCRQLTFVTAESDTVQRPDPVAYTVKSSDVKVKQAPSRRSSIRFSRLCGIDTGAL